MTTSTVMPDVKVEVAFNAGYFTPAASRTWTDVSDKVELDDKIVITHGRQDETSVADANHVTLTLDNTDGRFTAGKTSGAYYPNVKICRPIRITSTPVGGAASTRFLGYIDEWPNAWTNGTDTYSKAQVSATSRIAGLGFGAELRSVIEEEYLEDSPLALYTLGDPEGSTSASDSTTNNAAPLVVNGTGADVVFGDATGPAVDSLTAATFASGKYLRGDPIPGAGGDGTLEAFFICGPGAPSFAQSIAEIQSTFSGSGSTTTNQLWLSLEVKADGTLIGRQFDDVGGGGTCQSTARVDDGAVHHAALTVEGGFTMSLYLDGVLVDTDTTDAFYNYPLRLWVGSGDSSSGSGLGPYAGSVAHVAYYDTELTAARVAAHATAGLTGFAGESASDRIGRLAGYAGIPAAEYSGGAGSSPVDFIDTTGRTAIDSMRVAEDTESGVLYDARDNTLTFKARTARYNAASAFTVSATLQQIGADLEPKLDRSALVNDVTATASDGSTVHVVNQDSIDDYGYARQSISLAASSDVALQAATWRVNTYGEPEPRIPALGVNLLPLDLAGQTALLTADVGTRFTAADLPVQAPATALDVFAEGYTETIGKESYDFSFNVSPTTGYDVFTLGDPVRGVLGGPYPLAY